MAAPLSTLAGPSAAATFDVPLDHALHSAYCHKTLQAWQSVEPLRAQSLIYPLFIVDDPDAKQPIAAMPEQHRWGVNRLAEALDVPVARGLAAVLLFGVIDKASSKDDTGSAADAAGSPVRSAIAELRRRYPSLLIMTDLCLCGYTTHGHCGILRPDATIDNAASIARLASIAVAFAREGAHVIAPSDMMDGRIGAIKTALKAASLDGVVSVMSYAAKFASCFYGPFRDAAHSAMAFGDRSLYQLPPGSRGLALRAVDRDLSEGADMVMVKPAGPYLDIVRDTASRSPVPVAVYHVSGEYAMLYHAAAAGAFDLQRAVMETMTGFKRAGASLFITYFAPHILGWLHEEARAAVARADGAVTAAAAAAGAGRTA